MGTNHAPVPRSHARTLPARCRGALWETLWVLQDTRDALRARVRGAPTLPEAPATQTRENGESGRAASTCVPSAQGGRGPHPMQGLPVGQAPEGQEGRLLGRNPIRGGGAGLPPGPWR